MLGYPKILKTKEDYEYVRTHFPKEKWQADFEKLLTSQQEWFFVKELQTGEVGVTDDTHKVVVEPSFASDDQQTHNYQYELRDNPESPLARSGYSAEEVEAILNSSSEA